MLLITLTSYFFFNDTATTEIYTLSLHDALPISHSCLRTPASTTLQACRSGTGVCRVVHMSLTLPAIAKNRSSDTRSGTRSEEHTSELQSPCNLVCRLLLEKKKTVLRL